VEPLAGGLEPCHQLILRQAPDEPALQRLEDSVLEQVVVCDTIPVDPTTRPDKVRVLSVARILSETIHNVFTDDSVSAIFKGENQLF